MKKIVSFTLGALLFTSLLGSMRPAQAATTITSGSLVRGTTFSAVYYMGADGLRYVFPNDKTYYTWYKDFSTVKTISDAELAKIQIGGNVTYKPGVKMVKIDTDPKVYAVDAKGSLRYVASEAVATALYGSAWNKNIDDVPDSFFSNYTVSSNGIESASSFSVSAITAAATDINTDKGLHAPGNMYIGDSAYTPSSLTVSVGQTVRFTNTGNTKHSVTADDFSWGSGTIEVGGEYIQRFTKAGTFTFYDSYNGAIRGTIIVQ
jgi:plastocyanin